MAKRPYAKKTIFELEEIFHNNDGDASILTTLSHELSFRRMPKAKSLHTKIREALAADQQLVPKRIANNNSQKNRRLPTDIGQGAEQTRPEEAQQGMLDHMFVEPQTKRANVEICSAMAKRRLSPYTKTPDAPCAILNAWTALEALSPQSYKRAEDLASGDRSRVLMLERGAPWTLGIKSKPKHNLYFEVFLGSIALDKATDELVSVFGADEERTRPDGRRCSIGSVLVDKNGLVVEDGGIAISSFAWALHPALNLELETLGRWKDIETIVTSRVLEMFQRFDDDGEPVPVDLELILKVHNWLINELQIPVSLVEPPKFCMKVFHHFNSKAPPEPSLLNSFYLDDLVSAENLVQSNFAGKGLQAYLGMKRPTSKTDVREPRNAIEPLLAPHLFPQARWPSKGGHPLVLLQQAAVNAIRHELGSNSGIIGVNGPPGTGKTTLLRDIIAGCILDRATAMAGYNDPTDAFSTTGQKLAFGGSIFQHFYRIDDKLKGHEVVVASSNNKAVENVSKELPLREANGQHEKIAYFRSISDLIANPKPSKTFHEIDDLPQTTPIDTWGLIAAPLGNGRNRGNFQQSFWWDEDAGFLTYLKAARGIDVIREIKNHETGKVIERKQPSVVLNERPTTNEADALAAWRKAKTKFITIKKNVAQDLAAIEKIRKDINDLGVAFFNSEKLESQLAEARQSLTQLKSEESVRLSETETAVQQVDLVKREIESYLALKPGFFSRLFKTQVWKNWHLAFEQLRSRLVQATSNAQRMALQLTETRAKLTSVTTHAQSVQQELESVKSQIAQLKISTNEARQRLGDKIIDDEFFEKDYREFQLSSPWLPPEVHQKRDELFCAALELHKAFIDANAKFFQHNLGILMSAMSAGALQSQAHRDLLPDLWSSLFVVVPTISTTFASVQSMFGDLKTESIGWLLIDEAGQAVPQAAVGAIMRAKRTVVVGDPLQIPPVVSLPSKLNTEICKYFNIDEKIWSAPAASTQTLADQASSYKSRFATDLGDREVGLPLLVHRRCQNPMFDISNAIAYAGLMVHAAGNSKQERIGKTLGPSRWIHIEGNAETKWCPEEGDAVVELFRQLANEGVTNPDIFVITPFKIVEQEMRRRLSRETHLMASLELDADEWVKDRVGTVHTFQGREADAVVLLLGAPMSAHHRARQWAASPPNLINVAVSRAKERLYVVGSGTAWSGAGTSVELMQRQLLRQ